jgi:hypothetical protein
MENASSEPIRLKASAEILDRAGVRGGVEFDANININDTRSPAQIVAERLTRLASGAAEIASKLTDAGIIMPNNDESDIQDAEIVEG